MIRAALLDIDGTFLDSNDAHAEAWKIALDHFGYKKERSEIRRRIGMGGDNLLPSLIGIEADSHEGKKISEYRDRIFRKEFLHTLKPFPGSRDLLQRLKALGIKLVVATSSNRDDLSDLLKQAGIYDLIPAAVSGDDVGNSKPDADIVVKALGQAHVLPSEAVMIGDTPYDISAASKASVTSIAFKCGGWGTAELACAAAIYETPEDLLRNLEQSPLVRKIGVIKKSISQTLNI